MNQQSTFGDLKAECQSRLKLDPKTLNLFADQTLRKKVFGADANLLTQIGLKHGDTIYVGNKDVVMTGVAAAIEKEKQHEEALKRLEEAKNAPPK